MWIDRWSDFLSVVEGKPKRTVGDYVSSVRRMVDDLELERPDAVTREAIERHLKRRSLAGVGPSRRASATTAIRHFCRYLLAHGQLAGNPAAHLATPRAYRSTPKIFTTAEIRELLFGGREQALPRDRDELLQVLMFVVQYGGALRPAELGNVQTEDVRWLDDEGAFAILLRKSKHAREDQLQRIGDIPSRFLGQYLTLRSHLGPGPYLFPCRGAAPMSDDTVRRRFAQLAERRGIAAKGRALVPKLLRPSRCTHLLDEGAPLHYVQAFMRHKDPATTIRHYACLSDHQVARLLKRWDPLSKKKRRALPMGGVMRQLSEGLGALGAPN